MVKVATFDNPETMCRECWQDGELLVSYSAALLLQKNPIPAKSFFLGANIGPWKLGQIVGDPEAIQEQSDDG